MAQIEGQVSDSSSDGELDKWEFCGQAVKTKHNKIIKSRLERRLIDMQKGTKKQQQKGKANQQLQQLIVHN